MRRGVSSANQRYQRGKNALGLTPSTGNFDQLRDYAKLGVSVRVRQTAVAVGSVPESGLNREIAELANLGKSGIGVTPLYNSQHKAAGRAARTGGPASDRRPACLSTKAMVRAISTSVAQYVTIKTFASALRGLVVEELSPSLETEGRKLSETLAFPFSRPTFAASKTIFNLVAPDNEFERDFAHFLQDAPDVGRFAKGL